MTVIAKRLIKGAQLTTSTASLYTAPASTTAITKRVQFSNPSAVPASITAWVVPASGSASAQYQYINSLSMSPGETYTSPELSGVVLAAGDSIQALASVANAISVMASGVEIT